MFIIASFLGCEKDAEVLPKDYPYVVTETPIGEENGTVFSAEIINSGKTEIEYYGFVWGENEETYLLDCKKLFDGSAVQMKYSYTLKGGLAKDKDYNIRAYVKTNQLEVYGNKITFKSRGSLAPVINDFSPKNGPAGSKVVIDGENFAMSKTGNKVMFGENEAVVDSVSENKLIVTVPQINMSEKVLISIETADMLTTSVETFDLWFPWIRKADYPGTYLRETSSFELNGKIYICGGVDRRTWELSNEVWEYDPIIDAWVRKSDFPGEARRYGISFSCGGKGYFGMGEDFTNSINNKYLIDIWEYDPYSDQWSLKTNFPGTPVILTKSFIIDNKAIYWSLGTHGIIHITII